MRKAVSTLGVLRYGLVVFLLQTLVSAQTSGAKDAATASGGITPFTQTVDAIKAALPNGEFALPNRPFEPHPERLVRRKVSRKYVSTRNAVSGPFTDYHDFKTRGITIAPVTVVSYEVRDLPSVRIEMPQEYEEELVHANEPGSVFSPLRQRLQVADVPQLIDELPNPLFFSTYFLSNKANPEDDWSTQTYQSAGFVSATAMYPNGLFCFWKMKRTDPFLRADAVHEWSHQLRYKFADNALMQSFDDAVRFETNWSPNQYANRSATECFAVFGERLLSTSAAEFLECCDRAPIRSTLWMETLRLSMENLPPQYRSVNHAQYEKRIEHVLSKVKPVALASLRARRLEENDPSRQALLDKIIFRENH
ncbi:MAG TPA: hypothetical protein V6C76_04005 [Drouetiella sp.]